VSRGDFRWTSNVGQKIEPLYHAVLAVAPRERAAYLADTCKDDSGRRREIESLIAYSDATLETLVAPNERLPPGFCLGTE